jgi:hypothetical protein
MKTKSEPGGIARYAFRKLVKCYLTKPNIDENGKLVQYLECPLI